MNKRTFFSLLALFLAAVLLTACNPDLPPVDGTGDGQTVITGSGDFSLVNVSVPADRFTIPTPQAEAVYMDEYLPIALWDVTADGTRENMRLSFCHMASGEILEKEYPLTGTDVPQGVLRTKDAFYLIVPLADGYRGWTLSGTPEALTLTEADGTLIQQLLNEYETQHITSPDGTLSACHKQTDAWGNGGICLTDKDGTEKFIRENKILTDTSEDMGIQDIRAYAPVAFWGNETLVYSIGGWEWTIGYGFYDIASGEVREVENGKGILAATDDCLYTYLVMEYSITEVTKVEKDGTETIIADAETASDDLLPFFSENIIALEHTGEACIVWYYEDMMDTASLRLRVFDKELTAVLLDVDMGSIYAPLSDWIHFDNKILLFQVGN